MASPTYFTGAASGDPTAAGNWSNGIPVNSGVAVVPASCGRAMDGGDLSAVDVALWIVEEGYRFTIGSSGTRLQIAGAAIRHLGKGKGWYAAAHATADMDDVLVRSPGGADFDDDGTALIVNLLIEQGDVDYNCGGGSTRVEMVGEGMFRAISGAGTIAKYIQNAGRAYIDGVTATLAKLSGSGYLEFPGDNNGTIGAGGLYVDGAARCIYNSTTTLPLAEVHGGFLDFSQDGRAKTVSALYGRRPGRINKGFGNVTFTASSVQDGVLVGGITGV